MRITLPSGTPAEIDLSVANPVMGLVIMPDIFGMRPLFDDLVAQLAREWNMAVIAIDVKIENYENYFALRHPCRN
jgi:hypothetical protein